MTQIEWVTGLSAAIGICVAAGLVIGVDELRWMRAAGRLGRPRVREMLLSLSPLPINIVVSLALAGVWAALYTEAHALAVSTIPVNVATLAIAFLAVDLCYYWEHRCAHRLRWLWGLYHAAHHSSADYTIATAYRVSSINQILSPAFYLPLILIGFHPLLILGLQLVAFHYQAWLHTEMIGPLGMLDRCFNTPATHRVHHSAAEEHRDRNLGAITMLWDHLFGTYAAPQPDLRYGIHATPPPTSALAIYAEPWRREFASPVPLRDRPCPSRDE